MSSLKWRPFLEKAENKILSSVQATTKLFKEVIRRPENTTVTNKTSVYSNLSTGSIAAMGRPCCVVFRLLLPVGLN